MLTAPYEDPREKLRRRLDGLSEGVAKALLRVTTSGPFYGVVSREKQVTAAHVEGVLRDHPHLLLGTPWP